MLLFAPAAQAQESTVTVQLEEQNDSGISGTAMLVDLGNGQTRVEINITPAEGDHPAHIHMGTCANLNPAPEIPLANVQNGTSTTTVNQSLATIERQQRAINLHLSPSEAATYVACGSLPVAGTQPPNAVPQGQPNQAPAAPGPASAPPAAVAAGAVQVPASLPRTGELPGVSPGMIGLGLALAGAGLRLRRIRSQ